MVIKQCSISGMRAKGTLCKTFIMFNLSFIGTCEKGLRRNLQAGQWDVVEFFGSFL